MKLPYLQVRAGSHYSQNQNLARTKISKNVKPRKEVPKFGKHFWGRIYVRTFQNRSIDGISTFPRYSIVNMNPNQAFCVAIAVLLLQIMNIQQQQMFAFFNLYQRWMNEYRAVLNIACLRRQRRLRRMRVGPYTWTIPRPAESWFDIHYNDPTIPQEYFRQQLRVNKNTFELIRHILGPRLAEAKLEI